jgi:hypothetical protein
LTSSDAPSSSGMVPSLFTAGISDEVAFNALALLDRLL